MATKVTERDRDIIRDRIGYDVTLRRGLTTQVVFLVKAGSKIKNHTIITKIAGASYESRDSSTDSVSDDTVRIVKVKKPKPLSPLPEETSISSTDTDSSRSSSESSA